MKPTPEQLQKLPKWAQEHIEDMERQRLAAVHALNDYVDDQTESPFRYWDYICTGEQQGPPCRAKFIQTRKIEVHWAGVELAVLIRPSEKEIDLQWCSSNDLTTDTDLALIPKSFNSAVIKAKEHMR